jgi:hypothetical protein
VSRRTQGYTALAALAAAAVALIAVELANGARSFGESLARDPCTAQAAYPGEGLDATVQRIVLDGLNGAACELGVSREELVLSLEPEVAPEEIPWDRATIERAVRAGLLRAVEDAERRGDIGNVTALVLRELVERAPIDFLIQGGEEIADIVERVQDLDLGDLAEALEDLDLGDLLDQLPDIDLGGLLDDILGGLGG